MSLPDGPRANIEIKARLKDLAAAEGVARALGARDAGADRQTDVYFRVPRGRMKLRTSLFAGEQLIMYERSDESGPRRSDYEILPAPRGGRTREILASTLGIDAVVEKVRRLFVLGDTRIHLDRVEGVGTFIEFEAVYPFGVAAAERAARVSVERLLVAFSIDPEDLVPLSYRELVRSRESAS